MNVHNKNLMTISRMIHVDLSVVDDLLQRVHVGLSVPTDPTPNEWVCALTAVNLLARLYPRVYIEGSPEQTKALKELVVSIRPQIEVITEPTISQLDVLLIVGQGSSHLQAANSFYFDSNGWDCRLSRNQQIYAGGTINNPLAAAASACFATNEAFKVIFSAYLTDFEIADSFVLSLWDYSINDTAVVNEPLPPVNIGDVWLAGVGAVGNGFLYALSLLDDVSGTIHCVDNRNVDESNAQRYILVEKRTIGNPKVAVAERIQTGNLVIDAIPKTIDECFDDQSGMIDTLVCAVDTIQARRDIQARMPRLILNAWTRMDEFAVTRHIFGSEYRCLSCLYDKGQIRDQRDNISEATGLSLEEISALIKGNIGLTMETTSRIETFRAMTSGSLQAWAGRTIQSLYQEGICGGQVITTDTGEETVPIAHTSALAGILLAAELIKERFGYPLEHKVKFEMSAIPHQYLIQPELKTKHSSCICSDEVYVSVYQRKWKGVMTAI